MSKEEELIAAIQEQVAVLDRLLGRQIRAVQEVLTGSEAGGSLTPLARLLYVVYLIERFSPGGSSRFVEVNARRGRQFGVVRQTIADAVIQLEEAGLITTEIKNLRTHVELVGLEVDEVGGVPNA